jgi:hypothetical protein
LKFRVGGNGKSNSNQTFAQQLAVGLQLVLQGRDVGGGTSRAVDQAEYRIGSGTRIESVLHASGADRPAGLRLVAREARAPIGSKILKKALLDVCVSPFG